MCCSQALLPQLCHWNTPVTSEEHNVSHFQLFQESSYSPLFDNMLCLLVLFHWFALKLCVLYAQFVTPGICCSDWHQPGNVTWQFIAQTNHYPFAFLVFCNRRCSLRKSQHFSSQVFSCSAAVTLPIAPVTILKCYRACIGFTALRRNKVTAYSFQIVRKKKCFYLHTCCT